MEKFISDSQQHISLSSHQPSTGGINEYEKYEKLEPSHEIEG